MISAAEAAAKLRELKVELEAPVSFYSMYLAGWRSLAEQVTRDTLAALRPQGTDMDAAAWGQSIERLASQVTAGLLAEPLIGAMIELGAEPSDEEKLTPKYFDIRGVSVDDVVRWVAAGRDKESVDEPGKNLDERDAGKSDLQIAWRILYAIKNNRNAAGLEAVLKKFMGAEAAGTMEALLPAVLQAWVEHFRPRVKSDYSEWVHRMVVLHTK